MRVLPPPLLPTPPRRRVQPPTMAPPPRHVLPPGAGQHLQQETVRASAPAVARYNRISHGTQGVVTGMEAHDLATLRAQAQAHPGSAEFMAGLTNPFIWAEGAVKGARELGHGAGELAHGQFGRGALDVGLGGLSVASVLPVARGGKLASEVLRGSAHERAVTAALKRRDYTQVRDLAEASAPVERRARAAAKAALSKMPKDVFREVGLTEHDFARHLINGARMRYWYEESAREILHMAGGNKRVADKFAQVTAVMSANKEPLPNIQLATRAIHEFNTYGEVRTVGDEFQRAKANSILSGGEWQGVKTDRFYKNMLETIDSRKYKRMFGGNEVTNDVWVARLYGLKSDVPTPREYKAITEATQRAGKVLGWKAKHVQAAQWVSVKAENEPRAAAGGAATFADALALEHARLPFEAAPGVKTAPELHAAYQQLGDAEREKYASEKFKHVLNWLKDMGLGGAGGSGPGVFEGAVNPGRAVLMAASRQKGPFDKAALDAAAPGAERGAMHAANKAAGRTVQPEARVALDRVAATLGHALNRDASTWYKPFFVGVQKQHANGVRINIGKTITSDQARALDQTLRELGHGDKVAIVHHPNGADFLNIDPSLSNKQFQKIVAEALSKTNVPVGDRVLFTHDGNYIERGFYDSHMGTGIPAAHAADGGAGEGARVGADPGSLERRHADAHARLVAGLNSVDERYLGGGAGSDSGVIAAAKAAVAPVASAALGAAALKTGAHHLADPGALGVLTSMAGAVGRRVPARTPEEAHALIADAIARAEIQGHGGHVGSKGNPPVVPLGEATAETGGALGQMIRESLRHAPAVRTVQREGMTEDRTLRVRAAARASVQAGGGTAGHIAAKRHLADAYEREFFGHWKQLTPDEVHQLNLVVDQAPLAFFEKMHVKDSIQNGVDNGVVPTQGDQLLLERVFGRVAGHAEAEQAKLATAWDKFVEISNIPRAIRSSLDISAGFRQGMVVLVTHPGIWSRNFGKMVREFGSEEYHQAEMQAIRDDPYYPLYVKYKVPFTELDSNVAHTEEAFIGGKMAEKIPIAGHGIRASNRAFTGFQNRNRAEIFKVLFEKAALMGEDVHSDKLGESIAKLAGTFTGRGVTPKILEGHMTTLNALMFSPRLVASRLNLISPAYYMKLDPFARREARNAVRNMVGAMGTTLAVAKMLGAEVTFDPRSSDFGKIKIGNTRIDITGGFGPYVRLIAQQITGVKIASGGARTTIKYPGQHVGFGEKSWGSNLGQFGRSKLAPIPSTILDEFKSEDFLGRPISQKTEAWGNAPFIVQDVVEAARKGGTSAAVAAAFLSAIGFGVQTYKPSPPTNTGLGGTDLGGGGLGGTNLGGP